MNNEWRDEGLRSLLFVPADKAERFLDSARSSRPDAVIFDLEDGVAEASKGAARSTLRALLSHAALQCPVFIRINAPGTPWFDDDLHAVGVIHPDGVAIPKCENASEITLVRDSGTAAGMLESTAVLAMVETPLGVVNAYEIAATLGVVGLAFGAEDMAASLGVSPTEHGHELVYPRSAAVIAAAAAHKWAVDSPCLSFRELSSVSQEASNARQLGFAGKLAIHPSQVGPIHAAFQPSTDELARAEGVVAAVFADPESTGAYAVAGQMVDRPVLLQARRVLKRARLKE